MAKPQISKHIIVTEGDKTLHTKAGQIWNFMVRNWPNVALNDIEYILNLPITNDKTKPQ